MQTLQTFLDLLTKERHLHIGVLDFGGVLTTPNLQLDFKNVIHSKGFCRVAKSTEKGYRYCLRCKARANAKAIRQKEPFAGHCIYGLYEVGYPVVMNGAVAAIVYVGHAVVEEETTRKRLEKACACTGVAQMRLEEKLTFCERPGNPEELFQIAELTSDYLKWLYERTPHGKVSEHWIVSLMKHYADERYDTQLSLRELAITCQKNEKYIGRLFVRETGVSFHRYCNERRLQKAERLLAGGRDRVIDIALACGFNQVSYFNRLFLEKYGMSPLAYRRAQFARPSAHDTEAKA